MMVSTDNKVVTDDVPKDDSDMVARDSRLALKMGVDSNMSCIEELSDSMICGLDTAEDSVSSDT